MTLVHALAGLVNMQWCLYYCQLTRPLVCKADSATQEAHANDIKKSCMIYFVWFTELLTTVCAHATVQVSSHVSKL